MPAGETLRMRVASNVYNAIRMWRARAPGKEADWKKHHPDEWEIVMMVRNLERTHGV